MTDHAAIARARVHTTDVLILASRRLRKAGWHGAAAMLVDQAMDIAAELAELREREAEALGEPE